ncbi:MAG: hypothetical protein HKM95_05710, partial [Inquilinus sp.]|nr:hypothetical protein [Inquilinus sp.]
MNKGICGLLAALVLLAAPDGRAQSLFGDETFAFVAVGDFPYHRGGARDGSYTRLIDTVNAARPDFVLHVGDFKSGKSDCSDDRFALERDMLNSF